MVCHEEREFGELYEIALAVHVMISRWFAVAAFAAFLGGLWSNSRANRKAKEPFAPAVSLADYFAISLWILAVILIVVAKFVLK
jgi:uncharacterized membrane protein